jgi:hypothetical protein
VRTLLHIGVAIAFVLVAVGATFSALAVTGVLALMDRVEVRLGRRSEQGT